MASDGADETRSPPLLAPDSSSVSLARQGLAASALERLATELQKVTKFYQDYTEFAQTTRKMITDLNLHEIRENLYQLRYTEVRAIAAAHMWRMVADNAGLLIVDEEKKDRRRLWTEFAKAIHERHRRMEVALAAIASLY